MSAIRSILRWIGDRVRNFRELTNGDDLNDAQMHRGDYHEHRMLPPGP